MTTKRQKAKRTLLSFKDVQIAYLSNGMVGVEKLMMGHKKAAPILRKAIQQLQAIGENTEVLEAYTAKNYSPGIRGRLEPGIGENRLYKAQKIDRGNPFLRLPLSVMGAQKSDLISVFFEKDRIVIRKVQ